MKREGSITGADHRGRNHGQSCWGRANYTTENREYSAKNRRKIALIFKCNAPTIAVFPPIEIPLQPAN